MNELELRGCTVSASALAPLRSVKIKLLTAEECVVSAGGAIDIAALAVLFGETLEYLSIGGRGRHVHQAPSILNVKMLNRAKRLEKLKLNRFVVPNASVPAGLLPAHLVGQVGSQKLNLPQLRRVQISMVTGFTFNLLRNCRALEMVDLNYSLNDLFRFPPATTHLPEVREWRICDLPKLTELQVTYSEPNMTKSPRISACLKRKADGTLDEVELRSFRFRDNDLGLYGETVFLKTCYDWILNHGILREYEFGLRRLHTLNDADISYRHLTRFLNNSPLLGKLQFAVIYHINIHEISIIHTLLFFTDSHIVCIDTQKVFSLTCTALHRSLIFLRKIYTTGSVQNTLRRERRQCPSLGMRPIRALVSTCTCAKETLKCSSPSSSACAYVTAG